MDLPAGTVALVLTDVEGSTAAWDNDPAAMESQMAVHDAAIAEVIASAGGVLLKTKGEGDSTFSVFADPVAAVAAAARVLVELRRRAFPLAVRAAVHVGDVEPRAGDYFGPVPNRTARLRGLANGGQIVVSGAAAQLVRATLPPDLELVDLGVHELRGLSRPEHVFGLAHPELDDVESIAEPPPPAGNLPAPIDRFVGRDEDRVLLDKALRQHRLVTIVGPGGIGKSRLALQVAAEQAGDRPGGTWVIDMGELADGGDVAAAVVSALGIELDAETRPIEAIGAALLRSALVVLDTCEARIDDAAEFAEALLLQAPAVTVLATSREPLDARGEAILRLDPLDVETDAVALFLERASASALGGAEVDIAVATRVCSAVDGVPLAIELVAGRLAGESQDEVSRALANLDALVGDDAMRRRSGPARQRSLVETLRWSIEPLAQHERALLARLAVFSGGWPVDAPAEVCVSADLSAKQVTAAHAALVRRSLVQRDRVDEGRHRLLDVVREYVLRNEPPSPPEVARQFVAWAVTRADAITPDAIVAGAEGSTRQAYLAERANFRAAHAIAMAEGDGSATTRLAYAQADVWDMLGDARAGLLEAKAALQVATASDDRARGIAVVSYLSTCVGEFDQARRYLDEALSLVGDLSPKVACEVLNADVRLAFEMGAPEAEVVKRADAALAYARTLGDDVLVAIALNNVAVARGGDPVPERCAILREAAELERLSGHGVQARLNYLRLLLFGLSLDDAEALVAELVPLATDPAFEEWLWDLRCGLAVERGDARRAREAATEVLHSLRSVESFLRSEGFIVAIATAMVNQGDSRLARDIRGAMPDDLEFEAARPALDLRLAIADGDLAAARALLAEAGPRREGWSYMIEAEAELLLAEGRATEVVDLLHDAIEDRRANGHRAGERRLLRIVHRAAPESAAVAARLAELDAYAAGHADSPHA